jgi:hypothetical protein
MLCAAVCGCSQSCSSSNVGVGIYSDNKANTKLKLLGAAPNFVYNGNEDDFPESYIQSFDMKVTTTLKAGSTLYIGVTTDNGLGIWLDYYTTEGYDYEEYSYSATSGMPKTVDAPYENAFFSAAMAIQVCEK